MVNLVLSAITMTLCGGSLVGLIFGLAREGWVPVWAVLPLVVGCLLLMGAGACIMQMVHEHDQETE